MRVLMLVSFVSFTVVAGCGAEDLSVGSRNSALDITQFKLPSYSLQQRQTIVRKYDAFDPQNKVPRGLLEDALLYYKRNTAHIPKKTFIVVLDFSLFSGKDRFWLVDLATGAVEGHKTAHGSGSDPDHDGYATIFSNTYGSHQSSLGFALTAERYNGKHPNSMRLDGLSPSGSPKGMANTNMRSRGIVVHEATYVKDSNTSKQGRSWGCPALDTAIASSVVNRIYGGNLFYAAKAALHAPVGRAVCGDGVCEGLETLTSCAVDCQVIQPDAGVPNPDAGKSPPDLGGSADGLQPLPGRVDAFQPSQNLQGDVLLGGCAVGQGGDGRAVMLGLLALLGWVVWRRTRRS